MSTLAQRQAALVAALVANGEVPAGFDPARVLATRRALLRKRARTVAVAWPLLAASYGQAWPEVFVAWADGRPPAGAYRDGEDFARAHADSLPALAQEELRSRTAGPGWRRLPGRLLGALGRRTGRRTERRSDRRPTDPGRRAGTTGRT